MQTDNAPRGERLYVRLRHGDRLILRERASARGMAPATYVSVLVRAHLRQLAPLPKAELMALKRLTAELGAIGRNLNQIAHAMNRDQRPHAGPQRGHEHAEALRGAARCDQEGDQDESLELGGRSCGDSSLRIL
ncbi:MAG: plasmid mobilization relaxosome protein MobC [Proteobacteria bacterium]|nr:plasmid mobilization relaxosome protein MobC [Pseudomonadota bacterium]